MRLIVGLGNPGLEYENTRHNLGFVVIDYLAEKLGVESKQKKFNGLYYQNQDFILLKPQTYMNSSGECISSFLNYFAIPLDNLLVIYDEIALPLGKFRYRVQGSAGGHNGVKNIIKLLKSQNFKRLRIGIGRDKKFPLRDWVLGNFATKEKKEIERILPRLWESIEEWKKGNNFEKIMNNHNKQTEPC